MSAFFHDEVGSGWVAMPVAAVELPNIGKASSMLAGSMYAGSSGLISEGCKYRQPSVRHSSPNRHRCFLYRWSNLAFSSLEGWRLRQPPLEKGTYSGQKLETDLVRFLLNKIVPIDAIGTVASRSVFALSHALFEFVLFAGLQKDTPVVVDIVLSAGHD